MTVTSTLAANCATWRPLITVNALYYRYACKKVFGYLCRVLLRAVVSFESIGLPDVSGPIAAACLGLAVVMQRLIANDLADGLFGLADDPLLDLFRFAHRRTPTSLRPRRLKESTPGRRFDARCVRLWVM
ncbi:MULTISPECIES: hypothetical protein [unclassified Bradyrhizobium]|uniref:hypothetical protein n=1 Tax=unclassified Bradyrhizobium TaxID=2631580 RepID=UPI0020B1D1DD|nr:MULTISPECIES: hypothetical protein [unclassified Bradyrhizobium]MCP3402097.1 hypothetical protein [Bradyrhizobium sp. CCGB20]MCP3410585.1 hypothetical protein [Bradyrhizobium sp. CCGB01]